MNPFNCSTYRGVRVFSAMVLGLVAGAGISPGPARGAIASASYFYPLTPNATWTYRQTYWGLSNAVVRTVLANSKTIHGVAASGLKETVDGALNNIEWFSVSAGLRSHRLEFEEAATAAAGYYYQAPLLVLPAGIDVGGSYSFSGNFAVVYSGAGEPSSYPGQIQGQTQVAGWENVTAGGRVFTNCLKVVLSETWSDWSGSLQVQSTWWLAAGIGIVKATDPSGVVRELLSYSIPGGGGTAPVITQAPQSQTVLRGANVTFSVAATGAAPLSFQWQFQGANLPGQTGDTLALNNVQTNQAGDYQAVVSNTAGTATSSVARLTVNLPAPPPDSVLRFTGVRHLGSAVAELAFRAVAARTYQVESSTNLADWTPWLTLNADATNALFQVNYQGSFRHQFFRIKEAASTNTTTTNTVVTLPVPGVIYPEGTQIGGSLFGVEFAIPPQWKGGLKPKSCALLFGSDTQPGLVIAAIGFGWTRDQLLQEKELQTGFVSDMGAPLGKVFFAPTNPGNPVQAIGQDRIAAEYAGQGRDANGTPVTVTYNLEIVLHPNGGGLVLIGITSQPYQAQLKSQLQLFVASARMTARPTNTGYMNALNGRSYQWMNGGNEWYTSTPGAYNSDAGVSSWSESYAFFCAAGTFEVSRTETTYASANSPSQGFMSLSGDTNTREYGQWTIVTDPQYGNLLLMVTLTGYQIIPLRLDLDGTLLVGLNRLQQHGFFNCQ